MSNYWKEPIDVQSRQTLQKRFNKARNVYLLLLAPAILIITLLAANSRSAQEALMLVLTGLVYVIFVSALVIRGIVHLNSDLVLGEKICGEFPLTKEIRSGRYSTFLFLKVVIEGQPYLLQVRQDVYDVLVPGELIYVEFVPKSGTLFRLRHQGRDMVVALH